MFTNYRDRVAATLFAAVATPVAFADGQAENMDRRAYIAPTATYLIADDDRNSDDSFRGKLMFGKPVSKHVNLEFGFISNEFDADNSGTGQRFEEKGIKVDALLFLRRGKHFSPYIEAGIGAIETRNESLAGNVRSVDPAADVGLGFLYGSNKGGVSVRADVRHRFLFVDETVSGVNEDLFGDWEFNLGFVAPLGKKPEAPVQRVASAPTPRAPFNPDLDNDGVPNASDRCPATPPGTTVDRFGCPAAGDADQDGVIDDLDRCPNTALGLKVDINGCPLPETVIIYFAFDSAELTAEAEAALDRVGENLLRRSYVIAIASGHADSAGSDEYNQTLSQRRARAVAKYIEGRGVSSTQLRQRAYGESRPAADNSTREGRARNRRVEVHLLKQ